MLRAACGSLSCIVVWWWKQKPRIRRISALSAGWLQSRLLLNVVPLLSGEPDYNFGGGIIEMIYTSPVQIYRFLL
jgi:hypothetical protein